MVHAIDVATTVAVMTTADARRYTSRSLVTCSFNTFVHFHGLDYVMQTQDVAHRLEIIGCNLYNLRL